ncbi:hypothetical protein DU506_20820 [Vreelandella rituensis]|uniref:Uncharacterized protein n=1 Tax=Vreelandella rituensis TaxID=2282306 RepID=A0A368TM98_9GAMM|nr:hypothetical protein DU506_20820 [Halomonas rituensis]
MSPRFIALPSWFNDHVLVPDTAALVALLLTAVTDMQAGNHHGDIGQHRDQQAGHEPIEQRALPMQ